MPLVCYAPAADEETIATLGRRMEKLKKANPNFDTTPVAFAFVLVDVILIASVVTQLSRYTVSIAREKHAVATGLRRCVKGRSLDMSLIYNSAAC